MSGAFGCLLGGDSQVLSELSWVWGGPCHLNVDLSADVHPCPQSEVHAIGAVDKFLKLFCCDPFTDFPDAEGRTFRTNWAEGMVIETSFKIFGDSLVPATTWGHRCLCRLPPLLRLACAEFVMNVEELGCHDEVSARHILDAERSACCRWQHSRDEPAAASPAPVIVCGWMKVLFFNAPCWIRTNGRLLRRQLLYPAELRELDPHFGRRA